jgi:hypothetical protein
MQMIGRIVDSQQFLVAILNYAGNVSVQFIVARGCNKALPTFNGKDKL